jgi:hypothetical protein
VSADLLRRAADLIEEFDNGGVSYYASDRVPDPWCMICGPHVAAPLVAWLRDHAEAAAGHEVDPDHEDYVCGDYCAGELCAFAFARAVLNEYGPREGL